MLKFENTQKIKSQETMFIYCHECINVTEAPAYECKCPVCGSVDTDIIDHNEAETRFDGGLDFDI